MDRIHFYFALWAWVLLVIAECSLQTPRKVTKKKPCGEDWEPYKNERCLKVFGRKSKINIKSYEEAESFCKDYKGYLPTIDFKDKQRFVEEFLKRKKINGSVWIGLNTKWADGAKVQFSNWEAGYPKKDPGYCFQLKADAKDRNFGKWSQALCNENKFFVVCDQVQRWPWKELQLKIINQIRNPFPVGFIYVQLPKEKSPVEIWPWMGWSDISKDFNSTFFRVLGDKSAGFGEVQPSKAPQLQLEYVVFKDAPFFKDNQSGNFRGKYKEFDVPDHPEWSMPVLHQFTKTKPRAIEHFFYMMEKHDIRPSNMAMRIWKRND